MIDPQTGQSNEIDRPDQMGSARFEGLSRQVHIWHVDLDRCAALGDDTLSDEERVRAGRFVQALDRHRFVAARSALRAILAGILAHEDAGGRSLRFAYRPAGKPILADDPGLCFNVSHAEGQAVIAVTRAGEVGVDIERQRGLGEMDAVARLLFTAAERATLLRSAADQREAVFYRIWTCKEALLKAMGTGIAALGDPEAVVEAGTQWRVSTLPAPKGYALALAWPRQARALRSWSWPKAVFPHEANDRAADARDIVRAQTLQH